MQLNQRRALIIKLIGISAFCFMAGVGCEEDINEVLNELDDSPDAVSTEDTQKRVSPGNTIGAPCSKKSDCDSAVCLTGNSFADGYCSSQCGGHLQTKDSRCPDGSSCTQVGEAATVCLRDCPNGNSDCREGYACVDVFNSPVCYPACSNDSECEQGASCDPDLGICQSGGVSPGAAGAACESEADCEGEIAVCMTEAEDKSFKGGYCLSLCEGIEDGQYCTDKSGICAHIEDDDGSTIPICLGLCSTSVDCRPGYWCSTQADTSGVDGFGACLPNCGDHNLCDEEGLVCDTVAGYCVESEPTDIAPTPPKINVQSLGTVTITDDDDIKTVTIEVPKDAHSFTLVASATTNTTIYVTQVKTPSGKVIFEAGNPVISDYKLMHYSLLNNFTATFPNSPQLNISPGQYELTITTDDPTELSLTAIFKSTNSALKTGVLPVVFWFTKGEFWNAAEAQSDPVFQDGLNVFKSIYAQAGITLDPIQYKDLPEPQASELSVVSFTDVVKFFSAIGDNQDKGLNFFFCDQILSEDENSTLLGISAGIPGSPNLDNIPASGVVLAMAPVGDDASVFGETLAHEAGHYLGLYHLSEAEGTSHDPLLDTPECTAEFANITPGEKTDTTLCQEQGANNFMFWTPGDSVKQQEISPEQTWVLLRNPQVQ